MPALHECLPVSLPHGARTDRPCKSGGVREAVMSLGSTRLARESCEQLLLFLTVRPDTLRRSGARAKRRPGVGWVRPPRTRKISPIPPSPGDEMALGQILSPPVAHARKCPAPVFLGPYKGSGNIIWSNRKFTPDFKREAKRSAPLVGGTSLLTPSRGHPIPRMTTG